jgi:predicted MPP superfamily phosphohydrolase
MIEFSALEYLKLAIYYASYGYFVIATALLWVIFTKGGRRRVVAAGFLILISIFAYARFIEPRLLVTAEHDVELDHCAATAGHLRVAVFSDTHNGLFGNALSIERITNAVNKTRADFVLIPGDFVYFLRPDKFEKTFAALSAIKAPVFAVLGNHDVGLPGPDVSVLLMETLPALGVHVIDDQAVKLSNSKFEIELVGLSDQWAGAQKLSLLENASAIPRLVLTHHPSTSKDMVPGMTGDLLVGGHTHGGQILLPFVTCWFTGVCGNSAYGLREVEIGFTRHARQRNILMEMNRDTMQIFTTSGTGMVGLPLRFRVPPRVDVLNIRYPACAQ